MIKSVVKASWKLKWQRALLILHGNRHKCSSEYKQESVMNKTRKPPSENTMKTSGTEGNLEVGQDFRLSINETENYFQGSRTLWWYAVLPVCVCVCVCVNLNQYLIHLNLNI